MFISQQLPTITLPPPSKKSWRGFKKYGRVVVAVCSESWSRAWAAHDVAAVFYCFVFPRCLGSSQYRQYRSPLRFRSDRKARRWLGGLVGMAPLALLLFFRARYRCLLLISLACLPSFRHTSPTWQALTCMPSLLCSCLRGSVTVIGLHARTVVQCGAVCCCWAGLWCAALWFLRCFVSTCWCSTAVRTYSSVL